MNVLDNTALRSWARRAGENIASRFQGLGERERSRFTDPDDFLSREIGKNPLLRTLAAEATAGFRERMEAAHV